MDTLEHRLKWNKEYPWSQVGLWTMVCGPRCSGKTTIARNFMIENMINNSDSQCLWLAANVSMTDSIRYALSKSKRLKIKTNSYNKIVLKNGSSLKFARNLDGLLSKFDFVVMDEFDYMPKGAEMYSQLTYVNPNCRGLITAYAA